MTELNPCFEVRGSSKGKGMFATKPLEKCTPLFTEPAFFLVPVSTAPAAAHDEDHPPGLCTINIQHKNMPPCLRLVSEDTGGTIVGSLQTHRFAKQYAKSAPSVRQRVLGLAAFGRDETHAIAEVVRAEVALLRETDNELRAVPASELQRAVHRYWANCMGQEGSLFERGSRFNHSCAANCTRVTLKGGGAKRAFVTLRPVAAGEELTISYLPSGMETMGTVVRQRHLWLSRGFLCQCDRCAQPQDEVRQVECPECCNPSINAGAKSNHYRHGKEDRAQEALEAQGVFADWWKQSGMWVCRSCGWCSDIDPEGIGRIASSHRLRRKEGVLSAEIFALFMEGTVYRRSPKSRSRKSEMARDAGNTIIGGDRERLQKEDDEQRRQQARRKAIQELLKASVTFLGTRHWATFSCVMMRLQHEVSAHSADDSLGPRSKSLLFTPRAKPEFLNWAVRELLALWQWLSVALERATSHPPAYYLFDVVCDLLDLSEESSKSKELRIVVERVESWVEVFGDEEQRQRLLSLL